MASRFLIVNKRGHETIMAVLQREGVLTGFLLPSLARNQQGKIPAAVVPQVKFDREYATVAPSASKVTTKFLARHFVIALVCWS